LGGVARDTQVTINGPEAQVQRRRANDVTEQHEHRRHEQRDRGQKEQPGLQAGADPVVFLGVVVEAAEQKGRPQHEQRVGGDRAGDGGLDPHGLARTHGR
jgi:hypothetical protein